MDLINKYIAKYGGLKVFSVMLLGLLTLNIIIANIIGFNQKTFVIDGLGFKYDSISNSSLFSCFLSLLGSSLLAFPKG